MADNLVDGMLVSQSDGTRAQLLSRDGPGRWNAITFDGKRISVADGAVSPMSSDKLPADVDLVIGPASNQDIIAGGMMRELSQKGYCVNYLLKQQADIDKMHAAASYLQYERVPAEFEPYYLGRDSREKTALVDFEDFEVPSAVRNSPLAAEDEYMSSLFDILQSSMQETLGVRYEARTNLLVRQTFKDDEEERQFSASEPKNEERESFMGLMKRKRVCLMHFLGPETGYLSLSCKTSGQEVEIVAEPNTFVIFLTENFSYSYTCEAGASLALQCWFLFRAPQMRLQDISGDMEVLKKVEAGPQGPQGTANVVSGLACAMGGDSKDPTCMWLVVNKAGVDTACQFPTTRFDFDSYVDDSDMARAMAANKSYTRHQGYVDGIELFDSSFFGISPSEAKSMDPNQRKCLEVVYQACNNAGWTLKHLKSKAEHIGCFVGVSGSEWNFVPHEMDAAGCGSAEAIISNRLNFSLNLKGPSITMNTACSAGLVAINTAKLHLKYRDYDPLEGCVGGGMNLAYSPMPFVSCCSGGMLSFKGRCFTFDCSGDGYLRGEGATFCFLKPGTFDESTYALLAGSQANQDGRSATITAPNGPSQEKCIKAAFREAGLSPPEVDCFECHGTGTALGDPIEVGAFQRIYNAVPRSTSLSVTTSKTNYGHSEGGAGAVGFAKCVLQVMHAEGSGNLHLREFNPHIATDGFPAYFISENCITHYSTAYSGVSSFGFGGTNAHGMAYGKNILTSRVSDGAVDYRRAILNRITGAPPSEIFKPTDNPEDWESTGMPSLVNKPKMYQVEVNDDGATIWREVVSEPAGRLGKSFHLSGTFNDWGVTAMKEDPEVKGLFTAEVTINAFDGKECFHIVVDGVPDLIIYPSEPHCQYKTAEIKGPELPFGDARTCSWLIAAEPGTRFSIQFFRSASAKTISWIKL